MEALAVPLHPTLWVDDPDNPGEWEVVDEEILAVTLTGFDRDHVEWLTDICQATRWAIEFAVTSGARFKLAWPTCSDDEDMAVS